MSVLKKALDAKRNGTDLRTELPQFSMRDAAEGRVPGIRVLCVVDARGEVVDGDGRYRDIFSAGYDPAIVARTLAYHAEYEKSRLAAAAKTSASPKKQKQTATPTSGRWRDPSD